jgi:Flp pilus assembly protein TadD
MSLINDMLNELEKNKDKNNQPDSTTIDSNSLSKAPIEGTPDITFISQLPPADVEIFIKSEPAKEATATGVNLSDDKPKESNPTYRQPWETDALTPPANPTTDSPTINLDSKIIKGNKPSQKRLLIWIVIIGIACIALAILYFFPNTKKIEPTPLIVATPSAAPAPLPPVPTAAAPVEIQKDAVVSQAVDTLNSTPADKSTSSAQSNTANESTTTNHDNSTTSSKDETPKNQVPVDGVIEVAPAQLSPQIQAQNAYEQVMSNLSNLSSAQAIEQLQNITNQFPTFSQGRVALAVMLIKYGNSDQALSVLQTGLSQTPSNNQMAELAAHILVEKNQIKSALAVLKLAQPATIQTAPDYYALMAGLYLQEKDYKQASLFYQALTNLNPQNGTWWAGLAISLEKLGQTQAAMNAYGQAETVGGLSPALEAYIDQTMQGE